MIKRRIFVTQEFSQPVDVLFSRLADHDQLGAIFGAPVKRIQVGEDGANGVGSVRRIGPWPVGVQETVTALQPNERIEYRISRFGGPVRKHRGEMLFCETPNGSRVEWTIEFESLPVLGAGLELALAQAITRGLKRLS